jgi:hypothetical protein
MNDFQLTRDQQGVLRLTSGRHHQVAVNITLAFPLSDPDRWYAVRAREGEELAFIEDPATLPPATRQLLQEEVAMRHFLPRVARIHRIAGALRGLRVDLETDHGPTTITLDGDEQIRRLSDSRVVIIDNSGIRYLIPDIGQLDKASRARLERFY